MIWTPLFILRFDLLWTVNHMLTLGLKNLEAVQRRAKETRGVGNGLRGETTEGIRFIYLLQKRGYLGRLHYLNIGDTLRRKKCLRFLSHPGLVFPQWSCAVQEAEIRKMYTLDCCPGKGSCFLFWVFLEEQMEYEHILCPAILLLGIYPRKLVEMHLNTYIY